MFNYIDVKIKGIAKIVFVLSIIFSGICFYYLVIEYQGPDDIINWIGMGLSIGLIISGIISSIFIYGFGEIIYYLKRIDYNLNGDPEFDEDAYTDYED